MERHSARRSALLTAGVTGLILIGTGVPAWAFWSQPPSDAVVRTTATAMGTPRGGVSAVVTLRLVGLPVAGHLHFTITDPPATGPTPLSYRVTRLNGSTVCTIVSPATSCDGPTTLIPDVLGVYRVVAVRYQWESRHPAFVSVLSSIFTNGLSVGLTADAGGADAEVGGPMSLAVPGTPTLMAADDTGVEDDSVSNAAAPRVTGTADPDSTVRLTAGNTEVGRGTADDKGHYKIPVTLGDGDHAVIASTVQDGISSPGSASSDVVVDRSGPDLKVKAVGSGDDAKVTGTVGRDAGDQPTVTIQADNGAVVDATPTVDADGSFATAIKLKSGTTKVRVTQQDEAGNQTVRTVSFDGPDPAPAKNDPPPPATDASAPKKDDVTKDSTGSTNSGQDVPAATSTGGKAEDDPAPAQPADTSSTGKDAD
ncbi:MAG TPA: Ig-like domain-containing protein [Sporichthyaceae bacterium]